MAFRLKSYEDTNFTAGETGVVRSVFTDLGNTPAGDGYIACDGLGSIQVEFSTDGGAYQDPFTMKKGEVVTLRGAIVQLIRLTHLGTDSAYRILATSLGTGFES